ncbi:MAG TPA: HAMP domain-containing sensor histidine kinase [Bacteroidales bacterium]|nr:HAMP domain-containing sensor histidine kinase [Bacteroidales bacterium]
MKNSSIRLVVLLGSFSIVTILLFQLYWVYNTFDITENQFNQRVKIALYDVAEQMARFNQSQIPPDPVKQITSNYFVVNQEDIIDPTILEYFLKSEFEQSNIRMDFEYAIYNCETEEMVYGRYISQSPQGSTEVKRSEDFLKQEGLIYYYGVIFPGKNVSLLKSMDIWIISGLIIITALMFFSYAVFIILQQKKLSEIQKDFINNMTHEFKTPISTIAIASEALVQPEISGDPHRLFQYASIIGEQNERLKQQIEKVLQIATVEKSKIKLKLEKIELRKMLEEAVNNVKVHYPDPSLSFAIEAGQEPVYVLADRLHFSNILFNLLENAIKYGGNQIRLSIENFQWNVRVIVEDNGPGIDRNDLDKIFQKFYRIPSPEPSNIKGYGLGLYYVKNLVSAHKWKIWAESQLSAGSRFIIQITRT